MCCNDSWQREWVSENPLPEYKWWNIVMSFSPCMTDLQFFAAPVVCTSSCTCLNHTYGNVTGTNWHSRIGTKGRKYMEWREVVTNFTKFIVYYFSLPFLYFLLACVFFIFVNAFYKHFWVGTDPDIFDMYSLVFTLTSPITPGDKDIRPHQYQIQKKRIAARINIWHTIYHGLKFEDSKGY